ncbi:MAG: Sec-independent protein translocase protein TatA [Candidatus Poribacteria bacterium]|nr:MAG: Sec-independent protein translocase protein TatA [Candidatus Poribacteria bacterium]
MPFNLGPWEITLLIILALVIFGPRRLPEMARSFGEAIQEFKRAGRKVQEDVKTALEESPADESEKKKTA